MEMQYSAEGQKLAANRLRYIYLLGEPAEQGMEREAATLFAYGGASYTAPIDVVRQQS